MKKLKTLIKLLTFAGLLSISSVPSALGYANTPPIDAGYNNNLIDDQVFLNSNSMSVQAIQDFMNSKVPVCDTNHQGGLAQYPPPYTCLKDYIDPTTGKSSAQLIFDEAQSRGINPQVILVTLEKEQGLVTDSWPYPSQYKSAMGYGCPESQTVCDAQYNGLYNQVHLGSGLLRAGEARNCGDNNTLSGFFISSQWRLGGSPNVDGVPTLLNSCSTGSLYNYTPHRPDSAYTVRGNNCGTTHDQPCYYYGNYNFVNFFNNWFGTVYYHGNDPVGSFDLVQQAPGAVRLAGWGLDRSMTGPAAIHVYIDGGFAGAITADISRGDVGPHGFDGTVSYSVPGIHQVCAWVVGDDLGAPNAGLGCRPLVINDNPIGSLDLVQQTPGAVRLAGWGLDQSTATPAAIHVYIDGGFAGAIAANDPRGDIGGLFPGFNTTGFDASVPWTSAGTHQVCAWVVGDNIGASNAGLGCKSVVVNNDPVGSLDLVQKGSGVVRLAGWGLDRSMTGPAAIHVYIDGGFAGVLPANVSRGDVGPHGFDNSVAYATPGVHQVCAWVVGDNLGAPNAGLGCKSLSL